MNEQQYIQLMRDEQDRLINENVALKAENLRLRDALERVKNIAKYGAILYSEAASRFEKIERVANSFIFKKAA